MKFGHVRIITILLATQLLAAAGVAHAQATDPGQLPYPPNVRLSGAGFDTLTLTNDIVTQLPGGAFVLSGTQDGAVGADPAWQLDWNLTVDQHERLLGAIAGSVSLTNLGNIARDFYISVRIPFETAAHRETLTTGRISGLLEDFNDDGFARLGTLDTSPEQPIFTGDTNFSTVLRMFSLELSCTATVGGCTASSSEEMDPPGSFRRTGFASSEVGTWLMFNLSPGDRVTFDTAFAVKPVPLPAALPLFLLGFAPLYQLARKGRRVVNQAIRMINVASSPATA